MKRSELGVHVLEKGLNDGLVAFEKHPLPNPLRRNETGALQRGEVRRHGGLRQAAVRVDLARAHAMIERELLVGEMRIRLAQPAENLPPYGVGKRFVNRVDIERHVDRFSGHQLQGTNNRQAWRTLVAMHLHRYKTNHISEFDDILEAITDCGVDSYGRTNKPALSTWTAFRTKKNAAPIL